MAQDKNYADNTSLGVFSLLLAIMRIANYILLNLRRHTESYFPAIN